MTDNESIQLLIISKHHSQANQLLGSLRSANLSVKATGCESEAELSERLNSQQWDLVVCFETLALPAIDALKQLKQAELDTPFIFISDKNTTTKASALLQLGASDVIPITETERTLLSIKREVDSYQLKKTNRQLQINLSALEKRHQLLLDSATHPFSYIHEGMHIYCNQHYANLFSYTDTADITTTPLLDLVSPEDSPRLKQLLSQTLTSPESINIQAKPNSTESFPVEMLFTPIYYDDTPCLQLSIRQASSNTAHADKIQNQDLLTQLYNKAYFMTKVEEAIGSALQQDIFSTLLIIQVNEIVDIKSTIGQSNTNMVLNDISVFLQQSIQLKFSAARLNDQEFGIILDNGKPSEALKLADFIRSKINNQITTMTLPSLQLSSSIGIAVINGHALDAEAILSRARANINAPLQQNNSYNFRISDSLEYSSDEMLNYLDIALEKNRFKLLFQPIVNIRNDGSEGYEVLTRLLDNDDNEIPPGAFIPLANIKGMGEEIDKAILRIIIERIKSSNNSSTRFIINITSNTLLSTTFLPWLSNELQQAKISSDLLVFQISEIDLCNSLKHAIAFCKGLDELNLPKIICHFGCAIKPLEYLDIIKPKHVKLDKAVIRDIIYSQEQKNNARELIEALHQKGLRVVAPQIEDMSLLPLLWEINVDFVQGFCLQAPSQEMNYEFNQEEEITLHAPSA